MASGDDREGARACILCGVNIRFDIRSVCIDDDQAGGSGSNDDAHSPPLQWPAKPADYDSDKDLDNLSEDDDTIQSVEKFKAGEYVCLMVQGDELAYASFVVQKHVDLPVTALIKTPCGLKRFGPGVYALVAFCHTMPGVIFNSSSVCECRMLRRMLTRSIVLM